MATETAQIIKTPGFTYRGIDVPGLKISTDLINDLGTSDSAYKLAPKSVPLAWKVGLYIVGRDLALGEEDAEALPEQVREAGSMVYEDCQAKKGRGVWHKDAVVLLEPSAAIKGSVRPGNDYVAARFFQDIEGFDKETDEIRTLPGTREERIWVPKGGGNFIVPTGDGAYNPITGTPFETIADRGKAIKRWVDADLTEEQAKAELSRFYRGSGIRAVCSWSDGSSGPLCVDLGGGPWDGVSDLGSFAVSRSAERSEAPKNRGFRMLTKAEYEAFEADRARAAELESGMKELLGR